MSDRSLAASIVAVFVLASACVTPVQYLAPPDTPVALHPPARDLAGVPVDQFLVRAKVTAEDMPLTTTVFRHASQRAKESVVSLFVKGHNPARLYPLGLRIPGTSFGVKLPGQALGSGFFIHEDGWIITNDHVVRYADEVWALRNGETKPEVCTVVARDPVYDLALLKINGSGGRKYLPMPMGETRDVEVGEVVLAVGNPLGLGFTVTKGIVSQVDRNLHGVPPEEGREASYIQTDATIAPGSSGGPLVTLTGAWIGVNTLGSAVTQGLNFAVPARQVAEFLSAVSTGSGEWVDED